MSLESHGSIAVLALQIGENEQASLYGDWRMVSDLVEAFGGQCVEIVEGEGSPYGAHDLVGVECERKQKAVGFRTLALVSLGATVFTMISVSLHHVTPIAGQIVSGIGFLSAGVILRGPFGITGLTSAATIWAMAAIGMTVGTGHAGAGLSLSVFLLGAMLMVSLSESRYIGVCRYRYAVLAFQVAGGKSLIRIEEVLDEYHFPRSDYEWLPVTLSSDPAGTVGAERAPLMAWISVNTKGVFIHSQSAVCQVRRLTVCKALRMIFFDAQMGWRRRLARNIHRPAHRID